MSASRMKPWWVWYLGPDARPDDLRMFDTEEEAEGYQTDPKGRGHLGDKTMMRVAFRPWDTLAFTNDPLRTLPGPETKAETLARVRLEMLVVRLTKAGDDPQKMTYVEKELEPTDDELARAWGIIVASDEARQLRADRKAAKAAEQEEPEDA